MQAFEYANPATVHEAVGLLDTKWGEVNVLAGGTDLLSLMKEHIETPRRVVNIKNIRELGGIRKQGAGLRIGATVTFDDLERSAEVRHMYPVLAEAARGVSSPQIRNMGTVAGDLCQRPRCWYYRNGFGLLGQDKDGKSLIPDGENKYHAIFGNSGPAYFVSASSLGPALVALRARIRLVSASGSREVDAEKFFVTPRNAESRENALLPNELVTEVLLPAVDRHSSTYEVRQKEALDWPLATASVALNMTGDTVSSARIVLGHVAPTPWVAMEAEKTAAGKTISQSVAAEIATAAVAGATPLSQNHYKVQLARVAVKRALLKAATGRMA
ncbi:MAG TPA: xanthine dehydrogenase family protein subunit M [Bryobacteraceae bacterium]|nr:xanthine dehydrogenase family protein subunit M [Bryobacteraceae bacterium]